MCFVLDYASKLKELQKKYDAQAFKAGDVKYNASFSAPAAGNQGGGEGDGGSHQGGGGHGGSGGGGSGES